MINQFKNLNWVAVSIAFVLYCILGGLWFTVFFSEAYKVSLGKAGEVLPNLPIFIVGPALCTLVVTLTTAILFYALNISTIRQMLEFTLVIGLGFLVANTVNIAINPNIPHPLFYSLISGSYHLVGITLVNTILLWRK